MNNLRSLTWRKAALYGVVCINLALAACGGGDNGSGKSPAADNARKKALAAPTTTSTEPDLSGLAALLQTVPEGSWVSASLNRFSDVWTPADLRPLNLQSNPTPEKIIIAWSSFAWDSKRGDLILYGGGHANYSGNDVYRWHGTSRTWERASLPSQITLTPNGFHTAIDGVDAAPSSAHTYDNSLYLSVIDRFITFGGASYNTGNPYARPLTASTSSITGPYLFDPSKADGNKVGGTTGSHVQRVSAFPEIVGGNMWTNRDVHQGNVQGTPPSSHINGTTAYAQEGGKDVVYVAARPGQGTDATLYRYTLTDPVDVTQDKWEVVGKYWGGPSDQGAGAYDPVNKLFVRTGPLAQPVTYWDLNLAGPGNIDHSIVPTDLTGGLSLQLRSAGIAHDPIRGGFMVWNGGGDILKLTAPVPISTAGWTIQRINNPVGDVPAADTGTGVLGKFKYIAQLDAFMALQDPVEGKVWLYKPYGWQPPSITPNVLPEVAVTSPASGQSFTVGKQVTVQATASDPDGSIAKVEFYLGQILVGTSIGPAFGTTLSGQSAGNYTLTAIATDNRGATRTSAGVSISFVAAANVPPVVNITSPTNGASVDSSLAFSVTAVASDPDGSIASVKLYVDGNLYGTFAGTSSPYTMSVSGLSVGAHVLNVQATDSAGATTTSGTVSLSIISTTAGGTFTLQNGTGGYAGTRDTFLSNWNKTESNGTRTTLLDSGAYVDLVRLAIFQSEGGPVPNGAIIVSAELGLYKVSDYNYTYEARRMLVDWDEATATWNQAAPSRPWAVAGAAGSGTDYAASVDATSSVGYAPGWLALDVTAAVQAMSTGTTPNYGWRLRGVAGNGNEKRFASREYGVTEQRPRLIVQYVASNTAPSVSLTNPTAGQVFAAGQDVLVQAAASDGDGSITKVEFLRNGVLVGTSTGPSYAVTLSGLSAGSYVLTAVASDNDGAKTTSAPVAITVTPPANVPPTASISSPANGTNVSSTSTFTTVAAATDADGTVSSLALRVDGTLFATFIGTTSPYSMTVNGLSVGSHTLTVVATDNAGASTTSAAVGINVVRGPASTTVTLQEGLNGYSGTRDNFLSYWYKTANNGSRGLLLDSSAYVDLFRFAIFQSEGGPVPHGAVITSAQLSLYKVTEYNYTYEARRLLADWDEATSSWNQARTNQMWSGPGASNVGVDYAPALDGTGSVGYAPGWLTMDLSAAVQAMSSGSPNFGWRLRGVSGNSNEKRFASREYGTLDQRPKLVITYTAP